MCFKPLIIESNQLVLNQIKLKALIDNNYNRKYLLVNHFLRLENLILWLN